MFSFSAGDRIIQIDQMDEQPKIPEQKEGASTDISSHKKFESDKKAVEFFSIAKERLIDISNWHNLCGEASAKFLLTDSLGNAVSRSPIEGDHFRIDIPGPGSVAGDGYDWVKIEKITDQSNPNGNIESLSIRVRPAANPMDAMKGISHFFKDGASSTFLVERNNSIVKAEVHGRNETPNTETSGILDTIRNVVVALGAMVGFSKPQWQSLVDGIVK